MAEVSKDFKTATVGGGSVLLPQYEKLDGTMALVGENNPQPVQLSGGVVDDFNDMVRVQSTQKKWKTDFSGVALDSTKWEIKQQGAGQTVTVAAGELKITTGITINAETILLSKETFTIPLRAMVGAFISQKIANQEFYIELISVDANGNPEVSNVDKMGWRWAFGDSATNDFAVYQVQTSGIALLSSAAIDTNIPETAYGLWELEAFADEAWFHARLMDSPAGRSYSNVRHQNIPNSNKLYKVQIRAKNLGVAPATSTDFKFQFVNVVDYAELTAEITAGRGNVAQGQSIGVQVLNAPSIGTVASVTTVSQAYISPKIVQNSETVANIVVGTPFVGAARDTGITPLYGYYRLRIFADQPLSVEVYAGSNATLTANRIQETIVVPANTMVVKDVPLLARYCGIKVTNTGASPTTAVEILSALVANN